MNAIADMVLSAEHNMLLQIRDRLYEGRWDLFERDLRARVSGGPYVFDTVKASASLLATIHRHLEFIEEMRRWEESHHSTLQAAG